MNFYVVDENVAIVANDNLRRPRLAPQADDACRLSCVQMLRKVTKTEIIVIDDGGEVITKYRKYLDGKGQPGVGDALLKYVTDNQFNHRRVRRVALHRNESGEFREFPSDKELSKFDREDRIFVALASTSIGARRATILNAVDSDYSQHSTPLKLNNIRVLEICPQCVKDSG